jgi:hypothetical protein
MRNDEGFKDKQSPFHTELVGLNHRDTPDVRAVTFADSRPLRVGGMAFISAPLPTTLADEQLQVSAFRLIFLSSSAHFDLSFAKTISCRGY